MLAACSEGKRSTQAAAKNPFEIFEMSWLDQERKVGNPAAIHMSEKSPNHRMTQLTRL
jgi:hypothetical protein